MREFIENNPVFSFIAVPVLLIILVVLTYITIKPRSVLKDSFSGLYHKVLEAIEFIGKESKSFSLSHLKTLNKMIARIKTYYELLESEELYEVESIIGNIEKARAITRALIITKSDDVKIADYITEVSTELNAIRKALYAFNLTRQEDGTAGFSVVSPLNAKKSRKKAAEYLDSIKKAN